MFPRQTLTRAAKTKAAEKAQMSTIEKKSAGEPRKPALIKPPARGPAIHKGTLSIPPKEILAEWKHKQLSMLAKKVGTNCKGRKEDITKRLLAKREQIEVEEDNKVYGRHGTDSDSDNSASDTLPGIRHSDSNTEGVEAPVKVRAGKRKATVFESDDSEQELTSTPRRQKRQRSSQTQVLADSRVPNQESSLPSSSSGLMRPQDRAVGSRAPSPPEAVTSAVNFRDPEFFTIGVPASSPHSTTGPPNSPHTSVQGTAQEIIPRIGPLRLVDWEAASYTRRSKEEEEEREDETEMEIEEAAARTRPAEDTSTESAERTPR
ncbi:hypothetical protein DFH11DRAFT_1759042 [Phellopilus nigrolimitatus]|nr:hypothetical protein DFH11DRAFT_1759042 [Phellopilus nigrolimitatus]